MPGVKAQKVQTMARTQDAPTWPGAVQVPPNTVDLARAVVQLQESVNALITKFNAHKHATANDPPDALVTGARSTATTLFVDIDVP